MDQDRLAFLRSVAKDGTMRGDARDPETGSHLVAYLARKRYGLFGRDDSELRRGPERPIGLRPVDPDALADSLSIDAAADQVNDARAVTVGNDAWEGHPVAHPIGPFLVVPRVHA